MSKSASFALSVIVLVAVAVSASSQEQPKPKPEWRTVGPSSEYLANSLAASGDFYELSAVALLSEFARRGDVSIRYESRQLTSVPKLSLRGVKEPSKLSLFDLCQRILEPVGLTLLPEPSGARGFVVEPTYNAGEKAPIVKEEELANLASSEWAMVTYKVRGTSAAPLMSLAQGMVSGGGRIQSAADQPFLLIVDRASNIIRVLELFRTVDVPRADPKIVPYQRAAKTHLFDLASTLQRFLDRYAREINVPTGSFYLSWDHETRLLVGMVPQAVCSFLDSAVDAADKNALEAKAERELTGPNFVCFELAVPPERKAAAIEASLRALFEPEFVAGDMRTMLKGETTKSIVVRCRTWLESGVRDAADTLLK